MPVVILYLFIFLGLYNDNLDNQEEFDDSVPKLLEYFFRRLQSPICLLAHNGNRFDFPVLQAELKRLNYALNSNILCADTLVAFRSICLSHKLDNDSNFEEKSDGRNEHIPPTEVSNCVQISGDNHTNVSRAPKELVTRSQDTVQPEQMQSPSCVPISEDDIDDLLSQDLESFSCMDINLKTEESNYLKSKGNDISPSESNLKVNDIVHKTNGDQCIPSSAPIFDECTPPKSKIVPNFSENIKNIHRKRKMSSAARENGHTEHITPVKRTLFPKNDPLPLSKITKFSLENLYNHFFHEDPPVSHFAESDCISLSKVCQKISKEFLQWIDENSVTFSSVDAFW